MTDPGAPLTPPPPPSGPAPFAPPVRPRRRSMVLRHLASVAVALVLTPVGILVFDHGAGTYLDEWFRNLDAPAVSGDLLLMVLGALILVAVAACGRLSGLGPVLAGLVWGVVPFAWFVADLRSFSEFAQDLPSTYLWFRAPTYLFPLVAAMLLGAGLAGRWRGRLDA